MMGAPEPVRPPLRIEVAGAWPFITFRSYHLGDRPIVWRARHHRKGLWRADRAQEAGAVPVWQTRAYNWWNALAFAVGSCLFILGSVLALIPAGAAPPAALVNGVFFAGSIPFTIGGFMQNFQAANAAEFTPDPADASARRRVALIGWQPKNLGWLSTITQFIGTLQFNFNTFDPLVVSSGWVAQDLFVWTPGMVGSVLFLVSGYLAFIEAGHGYWSFRPKDLDWQIVSVNLLGCIFFMTASTLAWVPAGPEPGWIMDVSNIHLLLGGVGFLVGALLTMRESAAAAPG